MVSERLTGDLIHEVRSYPCTNKPLHEGGRLRSPNTACNSRNYLTTVSVKSFRTARSLLMNLGFFIAILSGAAVLLWPRPAYGRRRQQTGEDSCAASGRYQTDSEIVRDPQDLQAER